MAISLTGRSDDDVETADRRRGTTELTSTARSMSALWTRCMDCRGDAAVSRRTMLQAIGKRSRARPQSVGSAFGHHVRAAPALPSKAVLVRTAVRFAARLVMWSVW